MARRAHGTEDGIHEAMLAIGKLIHAAERKGLTIGRTVRVGAISGVVIGYNISRSGRFPAIRYPLLVETEMGTGKFSLDEVTPA